MKPTTGVEALKMLSSLVANPKSYLFNMMENVSFKVSPIPPERVNLSRFGCYRCTPIATNFHISPPDLDFATFPMLSYYLLS